MKHACAILKLHKTFVLENLLESTTGEIEASETTVVKIC
jgi:hypothetical protein